MIQVEFKADSLWITLNPYQGLKQEIKTLNTNCRNFELPWIPIRDWNQWERGSVCKANFLWITLNPYQGLKHKKALFGFAWQFALNYLESLSGIETDLVMRIASDSSSLNYLESLSGIETFEQTKEIFHRLLFELPWIPIRDWNACSSLLRELARCFELPWIPIRDWNPLRIYPISFNSNLWITLNPYQGLKQSTGFDNISNVRFELPWIPIRDWNSILNKNNHAAVPLNYLESLSGIETRSAEFWRECLQLWITLNPYQGLKQVD